jgi:hypothetical protein
MRGCFFLRTELIADERLQLLFGAERLDLLVRRPLAQQRLPTSAMVSGEAGAPPPLSPSDFG